MRGLCSIVLLVILITCSLSWATAKRISTKDLMTFYETYDTNEPPRLDGPTDIRIGMYVNNLLLDYEEGIMRMSIYLRMAWHDHRLHEIFHETDEKRVQLDDEMIERTWRPDLFIRNSDKSDKKGALMKEHLLRVNRTGNAWYVVKLVNNVYCPKLFSGRNTFVCPIMFESFSYTMDTLTLSWLDSPVDMDKGIHLRSHNVRDLILYDCSQNYTAGQFPCLEVRFVLTKERFELTFDRGVYLISSFLVIISWLGFWIPPSDKRIFLGLITTLILSVLYAVVAEWREFSSANTTRSCQIWLIFCLMMVLGMVLEYALVYIIFGAMCTKIRGCCSGTAPPEDKGPKRSRCGDILDTIFGLVIFPAIFIVAVFAVAFTTFAFR